MRLLYRGCLLLVQAILAEAVMAQSARLGECEPWCVNNACSVLNGEVTSECGACSPDHAVCAPGASDYPAEPSGDGSKAAASRLAVGSVGTVQPVLVEAEACRRITAEDLQGLSSAEAKAALLKEPTIITGLIGDWPDLSWFEELHFAAINPTTLSQEDKQAFRVAEEEVLRRLNRDYVVPHVLRRASAARVLSFQTGRGGVHITPNHGFAWLGLVNGSKTWYMAPSTARVPDEHFCAEAYGPRCETAGWEQCMLSLAGITHVCRQQTGEVVVTPTGWWHATCNVGIGGSVGIGGQDDCDLIRQGDMGCEPRLLPPERLLNTQGMPSICAADSLHVACHGEYGLQAHGLKPWALLQPDKQVVGLKNKKGTELERV